MVESLLLTCLQANFIIGRIRLNPYLSVEHKVELVREVKEITRKKCFTL